MHSNVAINGWYLYMKAYLKHDIAKRIGRSVSVVLSWVDQKLVIPEVMPAQGRGFARVYSEKNLVEFSFINVLLSRRQGLNTIRDIMAYTRKRADLKDFFTDKKWENDSKFDVWTDSDGHIFRVSVRGITQQPVVEAKEMEELKATEELDDSPVVIHLNLSKTLVEAKKRLGKE